MDVLVQVPSDAANNTQYTLFKYYPKNISIVASDFNTSGASAQALKEHLVWDCSSTPCTYGSKVNPLRPAFQPITNPYLFATNNLNEITNGSYTENFDGFDQPWVVAGTQPSNTKIPVAPLIKLSENGGELNIDFALVDDFPTSSECMGKNTSNILTCDKGTGQWQPALDGFGGGAVTAEELLSIKIDTTLTAIGPSQLPTNEQLNPVSYTHLRAHETV